MAHSNCKHRFREWDQVGLGDVQIDYVLAETQAFGFRQ